MTTTTSKSRPARRARKRKPASTPVPTPVRAIVPANTQGRTRLSKPNAKLISWQEYMNDFGNRMDVHHYEMQEVMADLRSCVAFTTETYKEYKHKFDNLNIGS